MLELYQRISLTKDFPEYNLKKGDKEPIIYFKETLINDSRISTKSNANC